jgi:hypothetical protein
MKKLFFFVVLVIISTSAIWAQNLGIKIKVSDAENLDALPGAVVTCNEKISSTNLEGIFEINAEAPQYIITIKYIGYQNYSDTISAAELKTTREIKLNKSSRQLDGVIISAGRYEQNISRVPVSIEIIKPALIENKNTVNLETIIDQVPGVNVIDGQVSIRGGSGFSYGAGSRVMMLVDDLPLLAGDAGDIKFSYLPVENIEQVEVLKAYYNTNDEIVWQELALYKVLSDEITEKVKVERLLREFGASAVAIRKDFIVFETTGHREETNKLMEALAPFGLVEFVRSARVAIIKESAGFHEKLKDFEKKSFNS